MKKLFYLVCALLAIAGTAWAIPPGGGSGIPYSGATGPVNLGSQDLTTTGSVSGGAVVVGTTDLGTPALNATATLSGQVGKIVIANNCIIDLTSWPASGKEGKKTLYMTNPGAATITWKTGGSTLTPKYVGGVAPTWTVSGLDVVVLTSIDGGTTVYMFVVGQDMR